jgi:lipopolysaccharide transport system ATP-binding protein
MKPILEIQNVGKKYTIQHLAGGYLSLRERISTALKFERHNTEDFWALKDVSFEVQPGESIGIIGRNGAGKSTLLKILSKITPPTTGRIVSRGRVASLLEVGTGFHPELTGRENIFFNGSLLGMKRKEIEAKFDEIVDFSGVEKFLDTPLKHFSSGMQLRLAFAVAAFLEPEILIIDEVLAVGDAEFQKKCLGKMEDVSKSGRTILFVSHNMGAIRNLCNKCVVLDRGNILYNGSVEGATRLYLSPANLSRNQEYITKPKNALMWLSSVQVNNQSDKAILYYGDELQIRLTCVSGEALMVYAGLVLSDQDGLRVLNANNRYQTSRLQVVKGTNTILCNLGVVPLMEGTYYLTIYFGDESKDVQVIENIITIDVHERDIWGNGKMPPKRISLFWWGTEFSLENS